MALDWAENVVPIPVSELQPFANTSCYSKPMVDERSIARRTLEDEFDPEKPEASYIQYLHRVFGFPHTSPNTMKEADFETAYNMALWSRCHDCQIVFKTDKRYTNHLRPKTVDQVELFLCPQNKAFTELETTQLKFNCTICKKDFDDSKRPKKQMGQHLITKKHMAKVNTEIEHREHQRLCDLVGISVD